MRSKESATWSQNYVPSCALVKFVLNGWTSGNGANCHRFIWNSFIIGKRSEFVKCTILENFSDQLTLH